MSKPNGSPNLKEMAIDPSIKEKVPAKYVYHFKFMPVGFDKETLQIAVSDPSDIQMLDDLKMVLGYDLDPIQADANDIGECLKKYYGIGADTLEKISASEPILKPASETKVIKEDLEELVEDASMIRFVNQILLEAYKDRATDIHIEPFENRLRIRYRVDGILYDKPIPEDVRNYHSSLVSRIKIMANLNIAEKRLPQDGRIKIKVGENELDLRVSVLPTQYGETVDIRLLSSQNLILGLSKLGLYEAGEKVLEKMLKKTHGVILVTGPTGSGKSTTLYTCLSKLNSVDKKIITIEDPIEYQLDGVTQLQVHPKIDFTFARGLRSILRHDPNIMMVGEIRDYETAEITIRCALTGHLVFSTLHTNDAASAVTRLIDMGVEPFLVSSSVECIIAQRLVRVLCTECKKPIQPDPTILKDFGIKEMPKDATFYDSVGCETCHFTGFQGRSAIYEILVVSEKIRAKVVQRVPASEIKLLAVKEGMITLRMDGWEKIKKGTTTIGEVLRVTQEESVVE